MRNDQRRRILEVFDISPKAAILSIITYIDQPLQCFSSQYTLQVCAVASEMFNIAPVLLSCQTSTSTENQPYRYPFIDAPLVRIGHLSALVTFVAPEASWIYQKPTLLQLHIQSDVSMITGFRENLDSESRFSNWSNWSS
jgi:hypothetical protein